MSRVLKPDSGQSLVLQNAGGSAALTIETNGNATIETGNLVIGTVDQGITFGGDPDSRNVSEGSRTLYDYESGSWTASVTDGTNAMTMNATYETGYYTKIGNLVTISGRFRTSSVASASGDIHISGLPFDCTNNQAANSGFTIGTGNNLNLASAGQCVSAYVFKSGDIIYLRVWDDTGGTTSMQASEWSDDGEIIISGSYRTG